METDGMKEKLLVVGSGGLGRVTIEHAIEKYDCAFVDDNYCVRTEIDGIKVVGSTSDLGKLYEDYKLLIVAIGNNAIREKIYKKASIIGYRFPNIICSSVYISPFAKIGRGSIFLNNVVIQNGAVVGDGAVFNPGVEIHHDSAVGDYCLIYTNSVVRTMAKLGDRVKLGSNVTIGNNGILPDDSVVEDGEIIKDNLEK